MQTRRRLGAAFGAAAIAVAGTAAAQTPPAEATIDRIRRTGVLRIAALPGEMPFFHKDLATGEWSGVAIDMAKSIATPFNARLEYVESTYANSVLDLQANKVDLAFALNPTPQRALAIGFTHAYYMHPFGFVARRGFAARTWDDLNRPEVRVVSLIGSLTDVLLARYAPKAQVLGAKQGDDAVLLMQAGRADCIMYALIQALSVSARAPMLEEVTLLQAPSVALPSAMGVQMEPDRRWRDYLNSWADYNTGTRQVGAWMRQSLLAMGVKAESIPTNADL
ncbi:MAG TPA: transporter substrate-binding domain-containing protein [Acetobacteraceae bacterium]|jgi:polar amino acid transport system substrate-binding protein|nr:transporter substrate-binding domain-containing protein [Acetobacteraceae bacterium]